MWAIIGLAGFFGVIVYLILLIVRAIKREPKKPVVLKLLVCVVLFAIGVSLTPSSNVEKDDKPDAPSAQATITPEPAPTPDSSPTLEPSAPEETTPTTEPTKPAESEYTIDLDTFMAVLRVMISQNFGENNYTMEYDGTGVTINLWSDNIAMGVAAAAIGDADALASWDYMVDSQKTLCNSIVKQAEDVGLENYYVMLNVLNDLDHSKTLLSVMNGVVIYDAVNG